MKIVIDTNVVMSGVFFGGKPLKVLNEVVEGRIDAFVTDDIADEYRVTADEMIHRGKGTIQEESLSQFLAKVKMVARKTGVEICRDPDDDKFIECAIDAKALYIVSGDKDLLTIGEYDEIEIITVTEFCERYGLK